MTSELSNRPTTRLGRFFEGDPLRTLQRQMDDLISGFSSEWEGGNGLSTDMHPSLDISETDDAIQVRVDLPGVKPDDVHVEVRRNHLQISGERTEEREEQGRTFHRTERRIGKFSRALTLPCDVQDDQVQAEYRDGILSVMLPKAETAKTHKVPVKSA